MAGYNAGIEPLVTVILPTRRRPDLLPRAVASVLQQSMADWELVLVDDNDPADRIRSRPEVVRWLADRRVRLVENPEPGGAGRARNRGLSVARGRYVTYLDDDDAYVPDKLQRQLQLAEATEAPLVLCGATYHLLRRTRRVQCERTKWSGDELLVGARWGSPLLFHRRVEGVAFDESLRAGEDLVFAHALLARFGLNDVPVVPAPLVDVYPQAGVRVNATAQPWQRVAKSVLRSTGARFSWASRKRFVLQLQLGEAKSRADRARCWRVGASLLWESAGADWRLVANALAVAAKIAPHRWTT